MLRAILHSRAHITGTMKFLSKFIRTEVLLVQYDDKITARERDSIGLSYSCTMNTPKQSLAKQGAHLIAKNLVVMSFLLTGLVPGSF